MVERAREAGVRGGKGTLAVAAFSGTVLSGGVPEGQKPGAVQDGNAGSNELAGALYSLPRESQWYYSQLSRQVEAAPEKVFSTAKQVKAWLLSNKAKLGIKDDEIQWTGISDWLDMQTGKVSKQQVMDTTSIENDLPRCRPVQVNSVR